jgi:hypothetical protein
MLAANAPMTALLSARFIVLSSCVWCSRLLVRGQNFIGQNIVVSIPGDNTLMAVPGEAQQSDLY